MQLFFIRHGQSVNNQLWAATGSSAGRSEDPELTPVGREQAKLLASFMAAKDAVAREDGKNMERKRDYFGFTHLYTSLMVRAVETASYIASALAMPLHAWPEIHECGGIYHGDEEEDELVGMPGKTRSYFAQHYQGLVLPESVTDDGWWNRPYEPYEVRPLRARAVLQTLLERHGDTNDRVAIVSHGGFYMELVRVIFRIGDENCWFSLYNTAVTRFTFRTDGETRLDYHNRTDHLTESMIT